MTEQDSAEKVNGVKSVYADLKIKEKAEAKMNEFYKVALDNLDNIQIAEQKKKPLLDLAQYLMGREV